MLHDLQEAIFSEKMSHGEISSEDIPARYWSAPIKALHPIKVYRDVDFGNTVVVQKIVNGIEYGKYIKPIYSPHYRGRDFTGSARNIYFMGDYQKPSSTNELRADFSQLSSSSTNEFQAMFDLMDAVQKMHDDYYDAVFSGKTPRSGDIPDRYWSELIKALHPIKVYDDLGNTVVVQKIVNGVEYGKYIGSVLSSHYPGPEFIRSRSNTNIPGMRDYQKRVIPK